MRLQTLFFASYIFSRDASYVSDKKNPKHIALCGIAKCVQAKRGRPPCFGGDKLNGEKATTR